jgi:hypothetical protein
MDPDVHRDDEAKRPGSLGRSRNDYSAPNQAHGCARRRRWRASSENHTFRSKPRREGKEPESPIDMERPTGIEPVALAWEARVLPLYEGRLAPILARVCGRLNSVVA